MNRMKRSARLVTTFLFVTLLWTTVNLTARAQSDPGSPGFEQVLMEIVAPYDWYRYQGSPSSGACANRNANCGPTVVAMAIQFATNTEVPITEVRKEMGGACGDSTNATQVRQALDHWNVTHVDITGLDAIRTAVNGQGHIVLVPANMSIVSHGTDYEKPASSPSTRLGLYKDPGNHWIVIKGFVTDAQGVEWVTAYDPFVFASGVYWYSDQTPKGKDRRYRASELVNAMAPQGNFGIEITGTPTANNVSGVVRATGTGTPVTGATVVYADGYQRSPTVIRTGSDGRYAFTTVRTGNAVVTAIQGNRIGSMPVNASGTYDITIATPTQHDIDLPFNGRLRTLFVSTGAPGDQTACTGVFSLATPASEVIYSDYLSFAGLKYRTSAHLD